MVKRDATRVQLFNSPEPADQRGPSEYLVALADNGITRSEAAT
jgi:hypothetical protein